MFRRVAAASVAILAWLGQANAAPEIAHLPDHPAIVAPNDGDKSDPAMPAIRRGIAHKKQGEIDQALKAYEAALRVNPKSVAALNARGGTYMDAGQFDLARADFDVALALDPKFQIAWFNRGLLNSKQSRFEQAIADFNAALKLDPNDAGALVERGRAYAGLQNLDRAIADFSAAIEIAPDDARIWGNRANAHLRRLQFNLALADADEALKRDPRASWGLLIRSGAHMGVGDRAAALRDLDALLAINPNDLHGLRGRSMLYKLAGQNERALEDLNAALAVNPDDADLLKSRAEVHAKLHHHDLALADYERFLAKKPDDTWANGSRLALLVESGKTEQAQRECRKLIDDYPGEGWPYLACSDVKRTLGDHKGANQDISKAIKVEPSLGESTGLLEDTASLQQLLATALIRAHAKELMDSGQYGDAAAEFERALKQGAPAKFILPDLCVGLSRSDRLGDAVSQCSRALEQNQGNGRLLEARGYAHYRQGNYVKALADFETLVRLYPRTARFLYERGVTRKKQGDAAGGDKDMAKAKEVSADVTNRIPEKMAL